MADRFFGSAENCSGGELAGNSAQQGVEGRHDQPVADDPVGEGADWPEGWPVAADQPQLGVTIGGDEFEATVEGGEPPWGRVWPHQRGVEESPGRPCGSGPSALPTRALDPRESR